MSRTRRVRLSLAAVAGCLLCVVLPRQCRTAKTADPLEPTRLPSSATVIRAVPVRRG